MAERRMFAKTIIDSDAFLEMPAMSQLLYFHLSMRADDDGFINKPKSIMRMLGCKDDDLRTLFSRKFIIPFETGIVVIKHWKIHNYIRKDCYTETKYKEEKEQLLLDENNAYSLDYDDMSRLRDDIVTSTSTQERIGKERKVKESTDKVKHKYGEYANVLLTDEEYEKLQNEYPDYEQRIENLSSYIESKGAKYKSHYATIRNWARKEKPADKRTQKAQELDAFYEMAAQFGRSE